MTEKRWASLSLINTRSKRLYINLVKKGSSNVF